MCFDAVVVVGIAAVGIAACILILGLIFYGSGACLTYRISLYIRTFGDE